MSRAAAVLIALLMFLCATFPALAEAAPAAPCGRLASGESLNPGESVVSCSGRFLFVHQRDGNVVLYDQASNNKPLFNTGTPNQATSFLAMQSDGNLVLYSPASRPLFNTGTFGNPGASLAVQDDGNVVISSASGVPLFATGVPMSMPAPAPGCGMLASGQSLRPGESVMSCNRRFWFVHQTDGNVVLYDQGNNNRPLFNTSTANRSTSVLAMQSDGNLVLYSAAFQPLFDSRTPGNPGASLAVQDDGNVVVYSVTGRALFDTFSFGRTAPPQAPPPAGGGGTRPPITPAPVAPSAVTRCGSCNAGEVITRRGGTSNPTCRGLQELTCLAFQGLPDFNQCGVGCPAGFHPLRLDFLLSCNDNGSGPPPGIANAARCELDRDMYRQCGTGCSGGSDFHVTSRANVPECRNSAFGPLPPDGSQVSCMRHAQRGAPVVDRFLQCDTQCPASFTRVRLFSSPMCGTGSVADNGAECVRR